MNYVKRVLSVLLFLGSLFSQVGCETQPRRAWTALRNSDASWEMPGKAFVDYHDYGPPNTPRILPGDREREYEFNGDRYLIPPHRQRLWPACF